MGGDSMVNKNIANVTVEVRMITLTSSDYPLVWRWRCRLPDRFGQRCRILARGRMNNVCVEFLDGFKVVTSGWAVRKA